MKMTWSDVHWSYFVLIIGALTTALGGFFQFRKEITALNKQAEQDSIALITEKNRVHEFATLLSESKVIHLKTNKNLKNSKRLIASADQSLKNHITLLQNQEEDLKVSYENLRQSVVLLKKQNELASSQLSAIRHILGSDIKPLLWCHMRDSGNSDYVIYTFALRNLDTTFASYNVTINLEDPLFLDNMNNYDGPTSEEILKALSSSKGTPKTVSVTRTIPKNEYIEIHRSYRRKIHDTSRFKIKIYWTGGYYDILVDAKSDGRIPSIMQVGSGNGQNPGREGMPVFEGFASFNQKKYRFSDDLRTFLCVKGQDYMVDILTNEKFVYKDPRFVQEDWE